MNFSEENSSVASHQKLCDIIIFKSIVPYLALEANIQLESVDGSINLNSSMWGYHLAFDFLRNLPGRHDKDYFM